MDEKNPTQPPKIGHISGETTTLCGLPVRTPDSAWLAFVPALSNCPECVAKCPEEFRHLQAQDGKTECGLEFDYDRVRLAHTPDQQDACPNCVAAVDHRLKQTVEEAAAEAKTEAERGVASIASVDAYIEEMRKAFPALTEERIAAAENAGRISPELAYEARRLLANAPTVAKLEAEAEGTVLEHKPSPPPDDPNRAQRLAELEENERLAAPYKLAAFEAELERHAAGRKMGGSRTINAATEAKAERPRTPNGSFSALAKGREPLCHWMDTPGLVRGLCDAVPAATDEPPHTSAWTRTREFVTCPTCRHMLNNAIAPVQHFVHAHTIGTMTKPVCGAPIPPGGQLRVTSDEKLVTCQDCLVLLTPVVWKPTPTQRAFSDAMLGLDLSTKRLEELSSMLRVETDASKVDPANPPDIFAPPEAVAEVVREVEARREMEEAIAGPAPQVMHMTEIATYNPEPEARAKIDEAVARLFAEARETPKGLPVSDWRPILLPIDPERMSRDILKNLHQKLGEGLAREVKLKAERDVARGRLTDTQRANDRLRVELDELQARIEKEREEKAKTEKQNEIAYRSWCDEARGAREDAEHFKTELADAKKLIAAQSNMYDALAAKSAALEAEKQAAVKAVCDQCDAEVTELRAQLAVRTGELSASEAEVRELRERLKVHAAHRDDAERRATAALDALAQAQNTIRDMSLARTRLEAEGAARRKLRERAKGREWWTMVDLVPGEIDVMACLEHDDNLRGIPRAIVAAVASATLVAVQDYMTVSSEELETLLRGTRAWAEEENGLDLEVYKQPAHCGVIMRLAEKDKVTP